MAIAKKIAELSDLQIDDRFFQIFVKKEEIDVRINSYQAKLAEILPVDMVAERDIVTFTLDGSEQHVCVGKGYLDQELEAAIVGMKVGQEKLLAFEGADLPVQILSAKRVNAPALTEENLGTLGLTDVNSLADLKKHAMEELAAEKKEAKQENLESFITDRLIEGSQIDTQGEEERDFEEFMKMVDEEIPAEEYDEFLKSYTGIANKEKALQKIHKMILQKIMQELCGGVWAERDGISWSQEEYAMEQINQYIESRYAVKYPKKV